MDSQTISPWRRLESTLNNPLPGNEILHTKNLNIVIIDSGIAPNPFKTPLVGILIVPRGLEGDDIFSSLEGNIQLLNSFFDVTRLILISNQTPRGERNENEYAINPAEKDRAQVAEVEAVLRGLMFRYYPEVCLNQPDPPEIRFLTCKEKLLLRRVRKVGLGHLEEFGRFCVTVELVEINGVKSLRSRLRLGNTHGWLHTDAVLKLVASNYIIDDPGFYESLTLRDMVCYGVILENSCFPEERHSSAMLYGLSLVSDYLDSDNQERRVLCLGLNDISTTVALGSGLGFDVIGIDNDPVITEALARFEKVGDNEITMAFHQYPDYLHELRFPGIKQGEEWEKMRATDFGKSGFDAIFIDINEPTPPSGSGICLCSPPRNFLREDTLMGATSVLRPNGLIVIHVVAPNYFFYCDIIKTLKDFVGKVYEARLKETEFVLVATRPEVEANTDTDAIPTAELMGDSFLKKLRDNLVPSFKFIELV